MEEKDIICAPKPILVEKGWLELSVDLWCQQIHLFIGSHTEMYDNYKEYFDGHPLEQTIVEDWFRRHPSADTNTSGDSFGESGHIFIRINPFVLGDLDGIAILAHECLHAANGILRYVGVMGDDNMEVMAYTQEFIFKGLMQKIMQKNTTPLIASMTKENLPDEP